jgi:GT2 family glycosyltransferase
VYGTGAAFLLVHRAAFAAIAHCTKDPYPWFRELVVSEGETTHWIGEDLFFCIQARRAGCRVFVHTGVHIEHVKPVRLTERLWREGVSL